MALSLVPLALTNGVAPMIAKPAVIGLGQLYRTAPVGLVGTVAAGVVNGGFWTFAPLFAHARVDSSVWVSLFMSACVMGGALGQWPIGRFSDRVDRRQVIVALCLASAAAGLVLSFAAGRSEALLLILGALFGAAALSLYPVCVVFANDRAEAPSFVEVSCHLLLAFGLGAIIGPFVAGVIISEAGTASLFVFSAAIHVALACFVLTRLRALKPVPEAERGTFSPHPPISHGTQAMLELQPVVDVQPEPHEPWADAMESRSDQPSSARPDLS